MREELLFFVDCNPHPKQRPRFDMRTGKIYNPVSNVEAEKLIRDAFMKKYPNHSVWEKSPIHVSVDFYFKSSEQHHDGWFHSSKPDIDNLIKTVFDALNGIAYHDDGLICSVNSCKFYDENPGIVIMLERYVGGDDCFDRNFER